MTIPEEFDFVAETEKLCAELYKRLPVHYVPINEHSFTNL